jgi:phosphoribosylamine--glycine ligase
MNILVIGGGGREHAIVWKLLQSAREPRIFCAPGNAGIAAERNTECLPWDGKDLSGLIAIAEKVKPDLTVVGPEQPLAMGLVDEFTNRGWKIFGPTKAAAQLEASKAFAKEFMRRHNIPTAHYAVCATEKEVDDAIKHFHGKVVVKADGLAAGKGVLICDDRNKARKAAHEMLGGRTVGPAGAKVVLEEFLEGEELSFMVLSDGERVVPLAPAQDHKRIGEGDTGPNTGGMGAFSTQAMLEPKMSEWLLTHVARPVVSGMKQEGIEYRGVLYCGLMMTARGPEVLEFNCRFGDPETQTILMRLEGDLVEALEDAAEGRLSEGELHWSKDAAACVVIASGGYPGEFAKGKVITGLEHAAEIDGVKVFHAGTAQRDGEIVTSGGRVLGVTARAESLTSALGRAYDAAELIKFDGMYYRRDIGARATRK